MINLNYNYLFNLCLNAREEILSSFIDCDISSAEVENILNELKICAKNSSGLLGYLYLHDFFKI